MPATENISQNETVEHHFSGGYSYAREWPEANTDATRSAAGGADARRGREGVALGNTAKRSAIQQNQGFQPHPDNLEWTKPDPETGEVTPFQVTVNHKREAVAKTYKTPQQVRAERYALKSVVHELLPDTRMCRCHRWRRKGESVKVMRGNQTGKAFFSGLQTCGSVWGCPLCAAKISERRRVELNHAIKQATALFLQVMLLTLTVPHGLGDDLNDITDKLNAAWSWLFNTREGRAIRKQLGIRGTIRASEVTHGLRSKLNNGFHPHLHILLFFDKPVTSFQVQFLISTLWRKACEKKGLPTPSHERGCRVDDGAKAANYCSKWGLESEMTKGHHKTGNKDKGMTPFDLLRAYLYDDDQEAGRLFQVYYNAYKGRRQLCWSKGLKKLLSVVDLTDEEIAAQEQEPASALAAFTPDQWRAVIKTKSEPLILNISEKAPDKLDDVIRMIQERYAQANREGPPRGGASVASAYRNPTNGIK